METTVQISLIAASASLIVAAITIYLNKMAERKDFIIQRKLKYYEELLNAISELGTTFDYKEKTDAIVKFIKAYNTMGLVAPMNVINALNEYHQEISTNQEKLDVNNQKIKYTNLLFEIRKNLNLKFKDNKKEFKFEKISLTNRKLG